MIPFQIRVTVPKDLRLDWPNQPQVLDQVAQLTARMLYARVVKKGLDAAQQPIPSVKSKRHGWFFIHKADPQLAQLDRSGFQPWAMKGEKGPPQWLVNRHGYREVKRKRAGTDRKTGFFTGRMWASLKATTKPLKGNPDGHVVRVYFAGSRKIGGKNGDPVRMRHRDMARLLQYYDRSEGTGFKPKGQLQFLLMRLAPKELAALSRFYLSKLRLFAPSSA